MSQDHHNHDLAFEKSGGHSARVNGSHDSELRDARNAPGVLPGPSGVFPAFALAYNISMSPRSRTCRPPRTSPGASWPVAPREAVHTCALEEPRASLMGTRRRPHLEQRHSRRRARDRRRRRPRSAKGPASCHAGLVRATDPSAYGWRRREEAMTRHDDMPTPEGFPSGRPKQSRRGRSSRTIRSRERRKPCGAGRNLAATFLRPSSLWVRAEVSRGR